MEQIYELIGLIIVVLSAIIGSILIIGFLVKIIVNKLGRVFTSLWTIIEFIYYRKEFKDWVKDKERIKRNSRDAKF